MTRGVVTRKRDRQITPFRVMDRSPMSTRSEKYKRSTPKSTILHSHLCLKHDTGYSLSQKITGQYLMNYPTPSNTSEDSWSEELPLITNTGRYDRVDFKDYDTNFSSYSLPSSELFDSPLLNSNSEILAMLNQADPRLPTPTSGRTTPQYRTQDSSLVEPPSSETQSLTGTRSGTMLNVESSTRSLPTSESIRTTPFAASPRTTWLPNQWSAQSMSSGEKRALARVAELGPKRLSQLTQRFHQQSSGMGTTDTNMWSSTNSPDKSESSTYSAGVIDTPLPWKPRGLQLSSTPRKSGLHQMWTQENGTPTHRNPKRKLSFDDL